MTAGKLINGARAQARSGGKRVSAARSAHTVSRGSGRRTRVLARGAISGHLTAFCASGIGLELSRGTYSALTLASGSTCN